MASPESASATHAAITPHVHALQSKHASVDAQLRAEMTRPAPDAATIQYLKKRKLQIKEEIERG